MRECVNAEKAAPGSLKAALNPDAARNRKPKAELLQKRIKLFHDKKDRSMEVFREAIKSGRLDYHTLPDGSFTIQKTTENCIR